MLKWKRNKQKGLREMTTYWFSICYLIVIWGFAIYAQIVSVGLNTFTLLLSALFFTLYFCLSLVQDRSSIYQWVLFLLVVVVTLTFWTPSFNGFLFLIILMIAKQAIDQLQGWNLYIHLFLQYVIVISSSVITQDFMLFSFLTLLVVLMGFLIFVWKRTEQTYILLNDRHDQLQSDFRKLKRQVVTNEKNVRQEERNQIAREIHDSVGHRLTALLMQLEVARLQTTNPTFQDKFNRFKSLAQVSLDETREAVKALKSEETAGLTAIIQLIRKLEAESHLRVSFHIQSGALSFPLSNKQSVTVYRAVQEALTNMMRHSEMKQAKIDFSVVGDHFFRFQISHSLEHKIQLREGFGLKEMRERLEQLGGSLGINQIEGEFRLIGTFPAERGEE
ncbi:sensor histidine kinase [Amphibacillus sp. Q70]|uniref:sensor histidine kinase n=1 Tax=Amphibacillus sp. Q70 TaxID=3453416 RepID=UPI003F83BD04